MEMHMQSSTQRNGARMSSVSMIDEVRAVRFRRWSRELNDGLRAKARELEEQYAAYKHKVRRKVDVEVDPGAKTVEKRVVEVHSNYDDTKIRLGVISYKENGRGRFYERYMHKRNAKLRQESGVKRAQREAKMRMMREILNESQAELKAKIEESEKLDRILALHSETRNKEQTLSRKSASSLGSRTPPRSLPRPLVKAAGQRKENAKPSAEIKEGKPPRSRSTKNSSPVPEPRLLLRKGRSVGPGSAAKLKAPVNSLPDMDLPSYVPDSSDADTVDSPASSQASWKRLPLYRMIGAGSKQKNKVATTVKEQQQAGKEAAAKGFKRFLKFGRRSKGQDREASNDHAPISTASEDDHGIDYDTQDSADNSLVGLTKTSESCILHIPSRLKSGKDYIPGSPLKGQHPFFSLASFQSKGSELKDRI